MVSSTSASTAEAGFPVLDDLGEAELLRRLERFAAPGQFRDDAAVVSPTPGCQLLISTDVLVEHQHFSAATTSADAVGWRAAMANLSDLAAMGAERVVGVTVGLGCPGSTAWTWVEGVYDGMTRALACHGGRLLGGDCVAAPVASLAVTAVGEVNPQRLIRRDAARPGDWLVCSGPHGLSGYGLDLLLQHVNPASASAQQREAVRAHCYPRARLDMVPMLADTRPPTVPWRVAGTDSSDGLARSLQLLCQNTGLGVQLTALPLSPALASCPNAYDYCLWGGEDFELVLALDPSWAQALLNHSRNVQHLGVVTGHGGIVLHHSLPPAARRALTEGCPHSPFRGTPLPG